MTGFVADLGVLDRVLQREVRDRFDHRNINLDVPEFGDGGMMPTGENLARFIAERVQAAVGRGGAGHACHGGGGRHPERDVRARLRPCA